ncbi:hypothetical protein ACRQU7_01420 [Caproiciproducens sp. R1]|uniref:hypothetical protein n=1 Tax=Caproiciproducens sp. R1 TaxID=3435000 RepID=UPI004034F03B
MKKRWYCIPAVLALVCLVLAGVVRVSYQNAGESIYNYGFETGNTFDVVFQEFSVTDVNQMPDKLIENSDIIIRAKYSGNRFVTGEGFYSPVTVEEVYKGDSEFNGKQLYILEAVDTYTYTRYVNTISKAYLPLQKNSEYVLLLKKVQFDPERKLTDFENSQYYPITQTAAGAYRLSNQKQTKVFSWAKNPESMNSLAGYDIPVEDKKQLDIYYQLKSGVLGELGIPLTSS